MQPQQHRCAKQLALHPTCLLPMQGGARSLQPLQSTLHLQEARHHLRDGLRLLVWAHLLAALRRLWLGRVPSVEVQLQPAQASAAAGRCAWRYQPAQPLSLVLRPLAAPLSGRELYLLAASLALARQ